ncbi:hypothetical protein ACFYO0_42040 [Streptomyces sp. NPDC006365]|uniref:hypothetical protein n=1 Tax=Streptomyces sp. NPDC006365 TaxID=3364744 RepID=UPI0036BEB35E
MLLFGAELLFGIAHAAGRIVVNAAGHASFPPSPGRVSGRTLREAHAVAVVLHQDDGDAERVGTVQLERGEGEIDRSLDGRDQLEQGSG